MMRESLVSNHFFHYFWSCIQVRLVLLVPALGMPSAPHLWPTSTEIDPLQLHTTFQNDPAMCLWSPKMTPLFAHAT